MKEMPMSRCPKDFTNGMRKGCPLAAETGAADECVVMFSVLWLLWGTKVRQDNGRYAY
jgi:hypothetical protein